MNARLDGGVGEALAGAAHAHPCPFCGAGSDFAFLAEDRNRRLSDERFAYHRCRACSTVFMVDVPADLARYYGGGYHPFDEQGAPLWRGDQALLDAEAWRVAALRRIVEPGRLLDIGAGAGGFVAAAQQGGFEVSAVEMDEECCRYIASQLGADAHCSDRPIETLRVLPQARVISLWHVLEHLPRPGEMLEAAAERLEPGGVLALGVPNPASIQFRLLRTRWAHLDAPRHLCLIPAPAILQRARALGLAPVLQTTSDPSGRSCNVHGWVYGLRGDPSEGPARGFPLRAGALLSNAFSPLEHRGSRGAALTLFLRKPNS